MLVTVALHEVGLHDRRLRSRPVRGRRLNSLFLYGGLAILLIAVVLSIDYWAADQLFVHMVEHIPLMFFAPILIVAGAPWLPLFTPSPWCAWARRRAAILSSGDSHLVVRRTRLDCAVAG